MRLGYNTNGFAFHRLADAIDILADIGYSSIALTLDCHHLDPFAADVADRAAELRTQLERRSLACTIETGARFLLDPRCKHQPTLISPTEAQRRTRISFLARAAEIAHCCGADTLSLWSGAATDNAPDQLLMDRLVAGVQKLLEQTEARGIRLAFEPEPGMFIDTMDQFDRLYRRVDHDRFGLTLDVGHVHCLADRTIREHVDRWQQVLWNVHIEDMRRGEHRHLLFGEGDIDFAEVFEALASVGYDGPLHVELSEHSRNAVDAAQRAYEFLRPWLGPGGQDR